MQVYSILRLPGSLCGLCSKNVQPAAGSTSACPTISSGELQQAVLAWKCAAVKSVVCKLSLCQMHRTFRLCIVVDVDGKVTRASRINSRLGRCTMHKLRDTVLILAMLFKQKLCLLGNLGRGCSARAEVLRMSLRAPNLISITAKRMGALADQSLGQGQVCGTS